MKFMFGLQHPLTCTPWTTLSNPCNKVRGEYFSKEVFLCLPSCIFVIASLMRRLSLCQYLSSIYMYATLCVVYIVSRGPLGTMDDWDGRWEFQGSPSYLHDPRIMTYPLHRKECVLCMALNRIWWWGSVSEDLFWIRSNC